MTGEKRVVQSGGHQSGQKGGSLDKYGIDASGRHLLGRFLSRHAAYGGRRWPGCGWSLSGQASKQESEASEMERRQEQISADATLTDGLDIRFSVLSESVYT